MQKVTSYRAKTPSLNLLFSIFLILLSSTGISAEQPADGSEFKNVRMIFGFQNTGIWEQRFVEGINRVVLEDSRVLITPEFIDLDVNDPVSIENYAEYVQLRSGQDDLVIAVQSEAGGFLYSWADRFFPAAHQLYVIPGDPLISQLVESDNVSVLPTSFDQAVEETLELVPQLLPETKFVYVISGSAQSDISYLNKMRADIDGFESSLEFRYLVGLTPNALIDELRELPEDSVLLMGTYNQDQTGRFYRSIDVSALISSQFDYPLFGMIDSYLGKGMVGGSVTSAGLYGEKAGRLVLSILFGNEYSDELYTATQYVFDRQKLDLVGIPVNRLPAGSTIINNELGFIERNFYQLLAALFIFSIQLISIIGLVISLRRRKKAEKERDQKVREQANQERLFGSVINNIPAAIFIYDVDGNVVDTNQGAAELFEVDKSELLGRHFKELVATSLLQQDQLEYATDALNNLGEQGDEAKILKYTKRSGVSFSGETIARRITNENKEVVGYFALIRDVSRRLSMEEEKRQGQKMEALGNLVGGICHDFNNILGVISGYSELSMITSEPEEIKDQQTQILDATDRAKALIAQIMTFSRDKNFEQKPINISELLDETMKLVGVSIPRNIEVTVKNDPDVKPVMGSQIQLQQIIINLATNARQAMKSEGGSILIALTRKLIKSEIILSQGVLKAGYYSVLEVSDTGPGMTREIASRIFEPYFTTKPHGEGSGMGMSIVYSLVKGHNAAIDLRTAPGKGTTITVYFNEATDSAAAIVDEEKKGIVLGNGERVLLVDDETELLNTTQ